MKIKESNSSEALECVNVLKEDGCITTLYQGKALETIRQALLGAQEQEKMLKIIFEKGFDRSIKDYDNYAIWLEYKTEQFGKAIEKHPTVLNWDVFDKFTYTQEEFDLLKRWKSESSGFKNR